MLTRTSCCLTIELRVDANNKHVATDKGEFNMTAAQLTSAFDLSEEQYLQDECQAFEILLQAELRSFAKIQDTHNQWEEAIQSGAARFSFQVDKDITARYRNWVFKARICLQQLELQEEKSCHPGSSEAFRKCLETAEKIILTRTQEEAAAISVLQEV